MNNFLEIDRTVKLAETIIPDARRRILEAVRCNTVRLQDPAGRLMYFSGTAEVQESRAAAREAARAAPRYNPNDRRLRTAGYTSSVVRPGPSDRVMATGYRVHLRDLEKFLGLEAGDLVDLHNAAAATDLPRDVGPIEQLLHMFERDGKNPAFEGLTRFGWQRRGSDLGISCTPREFKAAWSVATEAGDVIPRLGAPPREQQQKRQRKEALTIQPRKAGVT